MINKKYLQVHPYVQSDQSDVEYIYSDFAEESTTVNINKLIEHNYCDVILYKGTVIGFCVYAVHKHFIHIVMLAIDTRWRRGGVGHWYLEYLSRHIANRYQMIKYISVAVQESFLEAQLFFRACDFLWNKTESSTGISGGLVPISFYIMIKTLPGNKPPEPTRKPKLNLMNRIKKHLNLLDNPEDDGA